MKRLSWVVLALLIFGAAFVVVDDWRFWSRYVQMPDDPVANLDWFGVFESIGEGPVSDFAVAAPDERVVKMAALNEATEYAKSMDTYAFMVSINGAMQWEYFGPEFNADRMTDSQSMHKAVVPLVVGLAIESGAIASVDDPIGRYLDEWRDDPRGKITIRDLLYSESGLDAPRFSPSPFSVGMRGFNSSDIRQLIVQLKLLREPGSSFDFSYIGTQFLSLVVERATGQRYADFMRENLWAPAGAGKGRLRLDRPGGNAQTFCCIQTTARAWLRIGQIIAGGGRWNEQQIIPAAWVKQVLTPSRSPNFGMHVWLGSPYAKMRRSSETNPRAAVPNSAPFLVDDLYFFEGRGGQRVYVVPSLDLVIVRVGKVRMDWDDAKFVNSILAGVLPARIDYADDKNWAALPGGKDAADFAPRGETDNQSDAPADVFYIHPTTYYEKSQWNATLGDPVVAKAVAGVVKGQASAFNDCCRIYAPHYRQAALRAVFDRTGQGARAYNSAYLDVRNAFDEFIRRTGKRPFLVVGHSQGALHGKRLLSEVLHDEETSVRFAGAYIVGNGIPAAAYQVELAVTRACAHATDSRCIVSWNSFGPQADASRFRAMVRNMFAPSIKRHGTDEIQCNNPAAWADDEDGRPRGVAPTPDDRPLGAEITSAAGAACIDGALFLQTQPEKSFLPMAMPGGNYHLADFALFYANIRDNATQRVKQFFVDDQGSSIFDDDDSS